MINQLCSVCGEITGPASLCERCGGDPGAAEVRCQGCFGVKRVLRYARPGDFYEEWTDCPTCAHSGRPGYVEAPYILEHDRYAKLAYWMDCPLSEIPLRAPFKELREMEPSWWAVNRAEIAAFCRPSVTCPICGYWGAGELPDDTISCGFCDTADGRRSAARMRDWSQYSGLVPASLSAGGGA